MCITKERQIDKLIAQKVLKLKNVEIYDHDVIFWDESFGTSGSVPNYSLFLEDAMQVWYHFCRKKISVQLASFGNIWSCSIGTESKTHSVGNATSPALAICYAALDYAGVGRSLYDRSEEVVDMIQTRRVTNLGVETTNHHRTFTVTTIALNPDLQKKLTIMNRLPKQSLVSKWDDLKRNIKSILS